MSRKSEAEKLRILLESPSSPEAGEIQADASREELRELESFEDTGILLSQLSKSEPKLSLHPEQRAQVLAKSKLGRTSKVSGLRWLLILLMIGGTFLFLAQSMPKTIESVFSGVNARIDSLMKATAK